MNVAEMPGSTPSATGGAAAGSDGITAGAGLAAPALMTAIREAHAANRAAIEDVKAQAAAGRSVTRKAYPTACDVRAVPAATATAAAAGAVGGAGDAAASEVPEVNVLALSVKEDAEATPIADYLEFEWTVAGAAPEGTGLIAIRDLFKDKLSYSPATWDEVVALNVAMLPVMEQYDVLEDTEKARTELRKFLHNYACIGRLVAGVRTAVAGDASKLAELQRMVDDINARMRALAVAGALFGAPSHPSGSAAGVLAAAGLPAAEARSLVRLLKEARAATAPPAAVVAGGGGGGAAAAVGGSSVARRPQLLFRATTQGWTDVLFLQHAAGKPNLLLVVQDASKGYLFGGFSSVGFPAGAKPTSSITPVDDTSTFLFTLTNPHGIPPTWYKLKPGMKSGMAYYDGYGPMFGSQSSGNWDLLVGSPFNTNTSTRSDFGGTFEDTTGKGRGTFTGSSSFTVKEVWAFAL